MPNTREKLMRLLCDALEDGCVGHCNYPHCFKVKNTADHLIANGVTVQQWIPVTERLPGKYGMVLVYSKEFGNHYVAIHNCGKFWYDGIVIDTTHWMPLPEPPKGE